MQGELSKVQILAGGSIIIYPDPETKQINLTASSFSVCCNPEEDVASKGVKKYKPGRTCEISIPLKDAPITLNFVMNNPTYK